MAIRLEAIASRVKAITLRNKNRGSFEDMSYYVIRVHQMLEHSSLVFDGVRC